MDRPGGGREALSPAWIRDTTMTDQTQSELWAIVEVMGHARYAGRVSEYIALGVPLVRVEVPAVDGQPAFEKLLGASAIFRITPCDEAAATEAARQFGVSPLSLVSLPSREPSLLADKAYDDDEYGCR